MRFFFFDETFRNAMGSLYRSALVLSVGLAVYHSVVSGEWESALERCCNVGSSWGTNQTTCTGPPHPIPGIQPQDRSVCLTAIYICCIRMHRHLHCEQGKQVARSGQTCSLLPTLGGEAHKDCCDACALGLKAASRRIPCTFLNFRFDSPWSETYDECCHSASPNPGTSPLTERNKASCGPNHPCSQLCHIVGNTIQCSCHAGYRLASDQRTCEDVNECVLGTHTCNPATESCFNIMGGFQCLEKAVKNVIPGQCPAGYVRKPGSQTCDDIDECASGVCPPNQVCTNTVGSFICLPHSQSEDCPRGFRRHQTTGRCIDVDECAEGTDECDHALEFCLNSHGGYLCQPKPAKSKECPAGFKWSDESGICQDVDECVEDLFNCDGGNEECRNTIGGYECDPKCPEGQRFDETSNGCIATDSCAVNNQLCAPDEICMKIESKYVCVKRAIVQCPPGYKPAPAMDGTPPSCIDVDECKEALDTCDRDTELCINEIGSYECFPRHQTLEQISCQSGFRYHYEEQKCVDVDECEERLDFCNRTVETCVNVNGTFLCEKKESRDQCPPGYRYSIQTQTCEDVDECEENRHKCLPDKEYCINEPGAYRCHAVQADCPNGFRYSITANTCEDIDECAEDLHNCSLETHLCVNVAGRFHCYPKPSCPTGHVFSVEKNSCVDVDECAENTDSCNEEVQNCFNEIGSYRCVPKVPACPHGYRKDSSGTRCEDINECFEGIDDCDKTRQYCVNTIGSFQCHTKTTPPVHRCGNGYKKDPVTGTCIDVDECTEGSHTCNLASEICINNEGSFVCEAVTTTPTTTVSSSPPSATSNKRRLKAKQFSPKRKFKLAKTCPPGYTFSRASRSCIDINECEELAPCGPDQTCENSFGSYRCFCQQGYTLDTVNKICKDVNECQLGLHNCGPTQRCDNTIGSFICVRTTSCGTGYTLNADTQECEDDDECALGTHNCGQGFACRNIQGSFRCDRVKCPEGQKLLADGTCKLVNCNPGMQPDANGNCIDINECAIGNVCRRNQRCINTVGSYLCQNLLNCGIGYEMNEIGNQCIDVDECARGIHECGPQQSCRNHPGSYSCECPIGFTLNADRQCEDVDECARFRGQVCSITSECQNTPGSYICNCKEGFRKAEDGKYCIDVDECAESPGICHQTCVNVWGSYQCSCNQGYTLGPDGRTCQDIDECSLYEGRGNLCIGLCVNEPGSYSCACPDGYRLSNDKRTCQDIDECREHNVCKGENEVCLNTRGSFKCNMITCPPNYVRDREHRNRCKRPNVDCRPGDSECLKDPLTYSYNYITFVSNMRIPPTGQLDLFTMRGPRFTFTSVQFSLELKSARTPEGIPQATRDNFHLRRTAFNEAMVSLVKTISGPQEIELDLIMKMYHNGLFGGSAVAKIFIYVTQHEF